MKRSQESTTHLFAEVLSIPLRRSKRMTTDIGWVDTQRERSAHEVVEDFSTTTKEWNLYVCPQGDIRHAFVVHKDEALRKYNFFDYQGQYFLRDPTFVTSLVWARLSNKKYNPLGYMLTFGQKHEIFCEDFANACMKNSAFVMKYHLAPRDSSFSSPWPGDNIAPRFLTRSYMGKDHNQNYLERKRCWEEYKVLSSRPALVVDLSLDSP